MSSNDSIILQEKHLLKLLLDYPANIKKVDPKFFVTNTGMTIYQAMSHLQKNNVSINQENIVIEAGKLDKSINQLKIHTSFKDVLVKEGEFDYYYHSLKESYTKKNIKENILKNILEKFSSKESIDIEAVIDLKDELDSSLNLLSSKDKVKIYTPSQMFTEYEETLEARGNGNYFQDTGCSHLNKMLTEGFLPKTMATLFGASGVGKSAMAFSWFVKRVHKMIPSLYISPEMHLSANLDRLFAQRNEIPLSVFHLKNNNEEEQSFTFIQDLIQNEKIKLGNDKLPFRIIDEPSLSLSDVVDAIRETKIQLNTNKLVVTIDLATMLKDFNMTNNKANDYEHACNKLHEIAKKENVFILNVVQSKRPSEKIKVSCVEDVEKFRPAIEQIKNSSAFEERSRIIMSVYRARHYVEKLLPDAPELDILEDICELDILKQNMGSLGRLKYLFIPQFCKFYKYEEE